VQSLRQEHIDLKNQDVSNPIVRANKLRWIKDDINYYENKILGMWRLGWLPENMSDTENKMLNSVLFPEEDK
jgi:hypothetical protein